jgi:hypothetical protein
MPHEHLNCSAKFNDNNFNINFWGEKLIKSVFWGSKLVNMPITVGARSKALTVFVRSNVGIVGSKLTRGMNVCVRLFCVYVVLCVGSGLATG